MLYSLIFFPLFKEINVGKSPSSIEHLLTLTAQRQLITSQ